MKRIVWFAACLALLLGSARAAVAVRMDGAAALLTVDGGEIVAEGVYADIVSLGGEWFAASPDGERWSLLDANGTSLTSARYDEFCLRGDALLAHRDGGWGRMSRTGAELGAFDYEEILIDGAGGCWALREEDELLAVLLLDEDGRARDSGLRARQAGEPSEGLLPLRFEDGHWGYCDASGELTIPARFDWAGSFVSGCAAAVAGECYGAIDISGAWIVEPAYNFLEISPKGFLLAADGVRMFAADGSIIAEYPDEGAWAALVGEGCVVGDSEALRVLDSEGKPLETLAPDASVSEGVGGQFVISEGMWGEACVRLSGTDAAYQNLYPLGMANGASIYACMEANAARYQNDLLNEVQVSVDMDSARYGLVNGAGEPLLPCDYLSIQYLADDRFLARTESQWRMIDSRGKVYWRGGFTQTAAPSS